MKLIRIYWTSNCRLSTIFLTLILENDNDLPFWHYTLDVNYDLTLMLFLIIYVIFCYLSFVFTIHYLEKKMKIFVFICIFDNDKYLCVFPSFHLEISERHGFWVGIRGEEPKKAHVLAQRVVIRPKFFIPMVKFPKHNVWKVQNQFFNRNESRLTIT